MVKIWNHKILYIGKVRGLLELLSQISHEDYTLKQVIEDIFRGKN